MENRALTVIMDLVNELNEHDPSVHYIQHLAEKFNNDLKLLGMPIFKSRDVSLDIEIEDPYEGGTIWSSELAEFAKKDLEKCDKEHPNLEDRWCPRCNVRMPRGSMAWHEGYHFDSCL